MTTIAQLKQTLTEKQIAFKSKARKAELLALLPPPQPIAPVLTPLDVFYKKELARNYFGWTNNFVYQLNGDEELHSGFGAACYARFQRSESVTGLIVDIRGHYQNLPPPLEKHYPEWITGMLKDSPFSVAYREKSFEEAMEHGIHINVDTCSRSVCIAAAVALRGYHEFPKCASSYKRLREFNLPFRMVWFLMLTLQYSEKGWILNPKIGSNHCVVGVNWDKDHLIHTIQRGLAEDLESPFSKTVGGYEIFQTVSGYPTKAKVSPSGFCQQFHPFDNVTSGIDVWGEPVLRKSYTDAGVLQLAHNILNYK